MSFFPTQLQCNMLLRGTEQGVRRRKVNNRRQHNVLFFSPRENECQELARETAMKDFSLEFVSSLKGGKKAPRQIILLHQKLIFLRSNSGSRFLAVGRELGGLGAELPTLGLLRISYFPRDLLLRSCVKFEVMF